MKLCSPEHTGVFPYFKDQTQHLIRKKSISSLDGCHKVSWVRRKIFQNTQSWFKCTSGLYLMPEIEIVFNLLMFSFFSSCFEAGSKTKNMFSNHVLPLPH